MRTKHEIEHEQLKILFRSEGESSVPTHHVDKRKLIELNIERLEAEKPSLNPIHQRRASRTILNLKRQLNTKRKR